MPRRRAPSATGSASEAMDGPSRLGPLVASVAHDERLVRQWMNQTIPMVT